MFVLTWPPPPFILSIPSPHAFLQKWQVVVENCKFKELPLVEKSAHKLGAIYAVARKSVQKILFTLDCSAFNRMLLLKHETYIEDADVQTVEKE
jgi:hypothetical protein